MFMGPGFPGNPNRRARVPGPSDLEFLTLARGRDILIRDRLFRAGREKEIPDKTGVTVFVPEFCLGIRFTAAEHSARTVKVR